MHKRWTKEEDTILVENYHSLGPAVVQLLPDRSINAIKNRAQQLGLIFRQAMIGWTDAEIEILKTYYPVEGKEVITRLPGRTTKTIQVMAHRLGIKRR